MQMKFDAWDHWGGMPECVWPSVQPFHTVRVLLTQQPLPAGKKLPFQPFVTIHFREDGFAEHLAECMGKLNGKTSLDTDEKGLAKLLFNGEHKIGHHSTWYPWKENDPHSRYVYRGGPNPEYPVYVISKGRWELPLTARALERMKVPYTIVVEPSEQDAYENALALYAYATIQVAPENFSKRGQGSIPVRNYVWDLALKTGKDRHWLLDDNTPTFNRTNHNLGIRVESGATFRAIEVFADRYENVALAGMHTSQFTLAKAASAPLTLNSRIYSTTLIKNDLVLPGGRWRGRYNEDTDLCIRALKAGWCLVNFRTFNADKVGTMTMKGGNTDELYAGDGRTKMAQSLVEQHPDVVTMKWRFSRDQHVVDYKKCVEIGQSVVPGGCVLKMKPGVVIPEGVDNFGMVCYDRKTGEKVTL